MLYFNIYILINELSQTSIIFTIPTLNIYYLHILHER